jgi:hypothetical protein
MGGNPCPSVGFALGLERLILLIQEQNLSITDHANLQRIFFNPLFDLFGLFFVGFFYFNKIFHICPFK